MRNLCTATTHSWQLEQSPSSSEDPAQPKKEISHPGPGMHTVRKSVPWRLGSGVKPAQILQWGFSMFS